MAITRRTFHKGKMDKDSDERIVENGVYRDAVNVIVVDSENSDTGSVQNSFSNKKLTNLNLGTNVKCLRGITDESNDKIYWFTVSTYGCFLLEYDAKNFITSIVLGDTRAVGSRVLDLDENYLITGINKIINDNIEEDLLLWTDNNMQPCCINIERAKTYGINGFEKEDIYLAKKPPRYAPLIQMTYSNLNSNDITEKFLSFAYRYKYLDNEWSALSCFTNIAFVPDVYDLDYYTYDNLGMVNSFNAVNINYNTGDKRVKAIQIVVKESNSNNIYVIETVDKEKLGYADNVAKNYLFTNAKIYTLLPEVELYRTCDWVPLKAKTQTLVNNRVLFGNYLEGFDIVDDVKNKILINYNVKLKSEALNVIEDFAVNISNNTNAENYIEITNANTNIVLSKDSKIRFYLYVEVKAKPPYYSVNTKIYENSFEYILIDDYNNINDVLYSADFQVFFAAINQHFIDNYELILPSSLVKVNGPELEIYNLNDGIQVTQGEYQNTTTLAPVFLDFVFDPIISNVTWSKIASSSSCKSNRSYEVAIMYLDEWGRKTTALVSKNNTLYIPNGNSEFKNTISIELLHKPPFWADRYKFLIKTQPLDYYNITVNQFFREEAFVWVKLEGSEKDKLKIGDYLIVKKIPNKIVNEVIKVKVLDIQIQEKNFITNNSATEEAGIYFKIKPNSFEMKENEVIIKTNNANGFNHNPNFPPILVLDLFSEVDPITNIVTHRELRAGTIIKLSLDSSFNYKDGWSSHKLFKSYVCQRNYTDFEDWFNEVCFGRNFTDEDGHNYFVSIVKGYGDTDAGVVDGLIFYDDSSWAKMIYDPLGKLYLKVYGLESGGSKERAGYVDASITIIESAGDYIFETAQPKSIDNNIFYETTETFDIINGEHQGNIQNQNLALSQKAISDLSFFNCFSQGNGVESYRIKDAFNSKWMNIDFKPTSTIVDEYKEIRRFSDLIISEPYNNSTSYNGLNAFILTNDVIKELDKQYGSIQHLHTRDNDVVVFQEEKTSQVLYSKTVLFNADGSTNIASINKLLGSQVFYGGENGVGTSPESIAVEDYRIYFANPLRGIIQRLSIDGIENISNGMESYFRNLFNRFKKSKKIAGFDPYFKQYFFNFSETENNVAQANCGSTIIQYNSVEPFTYVLNLNEIIGDVILNFDISAGNADVVAIYDNTTYEELNVSGIGSLNIPRIDDFPDTIEITITPIGSTPISFEIMNVCPLVGSHHFSGKHFSSLHFST